MTTWQADDPKEVQRLVDQYEPYGAPLLEEREEAQMRFFELVDGARAELLGVLAEDATDDTGKRSGADLGAMEEALARYQAYPQEVQDLVAKLRKQMDRTVELAVDSLKAHERERDVAKVDAVLAKYEPFKAHFQEAHCGLTRHRERLSESMAERMARL